MKKLNHQLTPIHPLPDSLKEIGELLYTELLTKLPKPTDQPFRLAFVHGIHALDVFYIVDWLLQAGISVLQVDFICHDSILLHKVKDGIFSDSDLLDYLEGNITPVWLHNNGLKQWEVTPNLRYKLQFHWLDDHQDFSHEHEEYQVIIIGHHEIDSDNDYFLEKESNYHVILHPKYQTSRSA